jgi:hypothetical protein
MTIPLQHHDVNALQPKSNPRSPTSQGPILTSFYPPLAKPQAPQSQLYTHVSKVLTYPSAVFDTFDGGSKSKFFKVDAKISYILVIKFSI